MTLIVGIKCSAGIVVGSDGAATLATLGSRTIIQPTKNKLSLLKGPVIAGFSGPVGIAQRLCAQVESIWPQLQSKKPHEIMARLRNEFWGVLELEYRIAGVTKDVLGTGPAAQGAICQALIAMAISNKPELISFDHSGQPELASEDLPFVSIGSGQHTADPFLAFLRRLFWPGKLPTIPEGIFATLWTLDHAIEVSPGGVADPVQIALLERGADSWNASKLNELALQEHKEAITAAEQSLVNFGQRLSGAGSPDTTSPVP